MRVPVVNVLAGLRLFMGAQCTTRISFSNSIDRGAWVGLSKYNPRMNFNPDDIVPVLTAWGVPLFVTVLVTGLALWTATKAFASQPQNRLYRQLTYVAIVLVAQPVLVISLPLEESTKESLFTVFGYAVTAVVAFSSTSFVSNAMAGLMLKAMGTFHSGDFIRVDDQFGRVTAKGLLHTEIQNEDRDLVSLPNMLMITNPVQVVDQSGTLISTELSIGFDVQRRKVRDLLLEAAGQAGLTDPFVQIVNIGDYAVTYKVTGFLDDLGKIVSSKSDLRGAVLDTLHAAGVEVMTPSVMDQRRIEGAVLPPPDVTPEPEAESSNPESIMFDKAELAARIERFREQCVALQTEIADMEAANGEGNAAEIAWRKHQLTALQDIVQKFDEANGS